MKITYKGVTKDLKFYKGLKWSKPLTPKMKEFQKETGKKAVRGEAITGTFEYWMYWHPKHKKYYDDKLISKIRSLKIQISKYKNISNQEFVNDKKKELAETEQKLDDYYTHHETIQRLENQVYSLENEETWGFHKEAVDKRQKNWDKRREINKELKVLKKVKFK